MVYLTAIIDWHSKAALSYKISNTMDTSLVMDVLDQALSIISMDGKGRATDNICIERFWRSAKYECIYLNDYDSIAALQKDVDEYIDFYNHRRFHETLEYKKPMNVYQESILFNNGLDIAA